jgi:membrane dipeptidase
MRLIIDAHLDLAMGALSYNRDQTEDLDRINQREVGMKDHGARARATTCLPEMRKGCIGVCLGTVIARAKRHVQPVTGHRRTDLDYGTQSMAFAAAQAQLVYYQELVREGQMIHIRTSKELDDHLVRWNRNAVDSSTLPIGNILAMEGADPIVDVWQAELWFEQGLRSAMLSHYGASHYSVGTGENGPLTPRGFELLHEFERLGIILDLTHLSEQSFFEALDAYGGPVMASHNNCRTLVPGDRQFSDEQIKLLLERDAVIGVALDAWMLKPDWIIGTTQPDGLTMSAVVDHIDHICKLAGNTEHVGIGSDLDGGFGTEQTPCDLKSIADLQKLEPLLAKRGYSDSDIDRIFHGNWLRFFRKSLPS